MQEESEPHERTWMAFIANDEVWSAKQIPEVKKNLALVAKTIAKYEPVSMLVRPQDKTEAEQLIGDQTNFKHKVTLIETGLDDFWMRDTGPTFVFDENGKKYGVDFNFNGWGNKQIHAYDGEVSRFVSGKVGAKILETDLVVEGGSFEIDGHGNAMLTESSVLIDNRNPGVSKADFEKELKKLLGLKNIIWVKGIKGADITDAHIDFYARYIEEGRVLVARENYDQVSDYQVTRDNIETLKKESSIKEVIIMDNPDTFNEEFGADDFAPGYIGYYVCNGAVIMQKFGDANADAAAKEIVQKAYPNRVIEQLQVDGVASGGGSIHCITQQEPIFQGKRNLESSSLILMAYSAILLMFILLV